MVLCIALRHLGIEREILVLKKGKGDNFHLFPPYAIKGIGNVDVHMSWHESGERHFAVKLNGHQGKEETAIQEKSIVNLCPPSELQGVVQLYKSGIFLNHFDESLPVGTNEGQVVLLDATAAGFRDDFIAINVYAVSPGAEDQIPVYRDTGPRILHLAKETIPWLAIEVFQQTAHPREGEFEQCQPKESLDLSSG
jgi:hypothetical protein